MPKKIKIYKVAVVSLILATTLPFLSFLLRIDLSLYNTDPGQFWVSAALYVANTAALIGTILFFWEFVLGSRFLARLISDDLIWLNSLHQWIGKYGLLLIFLHPSLVIYNYTQKGIDIITPNLSSALEPALTFGKIAYGLFIIIFISSAILRSKIKYRPWKYLHYLTYPLMLLVFVHAPSLGTFINQSIVLQALWYTLMGAYILILIFRFILAGGWLKPLYTVIEKRLLPGDIVLLTLRPNKQKIIPKPGQYMYLQFESFGESHPFSVMEFDENSGNLTFAIKSVGAFTRLATDLDLGDIIMADGPYGVFTLEAQNAEPKIILAGGVGVTPFVELSKRYGDSKTFFLHANRFLNQAVNRKLLADKLGNNYFDFISEENGEGRINVINGRISSQAIEQIVGKMPLNDFNFFVCGSPIFVQSMLKMLAEMKIPTSKIFYEKFTL